jgi:hypothetical protein
VGARHDLNKFHVIGSLVAAAILGGATSSWTVFAVTGAALIATAIYTGEIRGRGRRR